VLCIDQHGQGSTTRYFSLSTERIDSQHWSLFIPNDIIWAARPAEIAKPDIAIFRKKRSRDE